MAWITEHARVWRGFALLLLLVSIIGPWTFDLINVPAEYPCSAPFVRLEGDYCGLPLSGTYMLFALGSGLVYTVSGLVTETLVFTESGRTLLIVLIAFLLLLSLISTLLLILRGNRRGLQIFQIVVLCLAGGLVLWLIMTGPELYWSRLWGPRLYGGVVLVLLILEGIAFRQQKEGKPGNMTNRNGKAFLANLPGVLLRRGVQG